MGETSLQMVLHLSFAVLDCSQHQGCIAACTWRQMCLVHLLRELKKVDKHLDSSNDWGEFRNKVKRLVLDAIRLWQRREEYSETYASRRARIIGRLDALLADD